MTGGKPVHIAACALPLRISGDLPVSEEFSQLAAARQRPLAKHVKKQR